MWCLPHQLQWVLTVSKEETMRKPVPQTKEDNMKPPINKRTTTLPPLPQPKVEAETETETEVETKPT